MPGGCSEVRLPGTLVDEPISQLGFLGRYLWTNEAPSAHEQQAISTYLVGPRQQLQDVGKEIKKAPLVAHIQKYRVISSLIRRLPRDIL
jgi:hypothetical protein